MPSQTPEAASNHGYWSATFAALAAMFVGIGLARFAYTPLLPALIAAGWFSPEQAAYLGAANLAGYLAGALAGQRLAALVSTRVAARALMTATAVSFVCCAGPASFAWFFAWRFVSGATGGALMVMAAPSALRLVPPRRRGLASGLIFTGVGLGIAVSGTLTPILLSQGLTATWLGYGAITAVVTVAVWPAWPGDAPPAPPLSGPAGARTHWPGQALAIVLAYGLVAAALVPHMVFLVDYVVRGLGAGIATGAAYWVLFGVSAALGPTIAGTVADRTGFAVAVQAALLLQIAAIACLLVSSDTATLVCSSIVIGAFVPGNVPLVLGRIQELFGDPHARQSAWRAATVVFAIGQAAAAYGMSSAFAASEGSYRLLFALATAAISAALAVDLIGGAAARFGTQSPRP